MRKEEHGLYDAWSKADAVWSIFSFYCWDKEVSDKKNLAVAIDSLVEIAKLPRAEDADDLREMCGLKRLGVVSSGSNAREVAASSENNLLKKEINDKDAQIRQIDAEIKQKRELARLLKIELEKALGKSSALPRPLEDQSSTLSPSYSRHSSRKISLSGVRISPAPSRPLALATMDEMIAQGRDFIEVEDVTGDEGHHD